MTADPTETVATPAFTMIGSDDAAACVGDSCAFEAPAADRDADATE